MDQPIENASANMTIGEVDLTRNDLDENLFQDFTKMTFKRYSDRNIQDYSLWAAIHSEFEKREEKHW